MQCVCVRACVCHGLAGVGVTPCAVMVPTRASQPLNYQAIPAGSQAWWYVCWLPFSSGLPSSTEAAWCDAHGADECFEGTLLVCSQQRWFPIALSSAPLLGATTEHAPGVTDNQSLSAPLHGCMDARMDGRPRIALQQPTAPRECAVGPKSPRARALPTRAPPPGRSGINPHSGFFYRGFY